MFTYRVRLHQVSRLCGQALLLLDVVSHVAELLLQHTHSLKVGSVVEGITAQEQELMRRREKNFLIKVTCANRFLRFDSTKIQLKRGQHFNPVKVIGQTVSHI